MSSICQVQEIDPAVNKEAPAQKERVLVLFFLKRHTYHPGTLKGRKPAHTYTLLCTFTHSSVPRCSAQLRINLVMLLSSYPHVASFLGKRCGPGTCILVKEESGSGEP